MFKKKPSLQEFIQIILAIMFVIWLGYFFSSSMEKHIYKATQGRFPSKTFSMAYLKYVLEINSTTRIGDKTPIQYAIMNYGPLTDRKIKKLRPVVQMFQDEGVNIDERSALGLTALHYAVLSEDAKAVEFLISMKTNVNQTVNTDQAEQVSKPLDYNEMTPLRLLEERKKLKLIKSEKRFQEIETMLKSAGGISEGPAEIKKIEAPKPAAKKPAKKKKK